MATLPLDLSSVVCSLTSSLACRHGTMIHGVLLLSQLSLCLTCGNGAGLGLDRGWEWDWDGMGYMMYSLIPRLLCMGTILCGVVKTESTAHHVLFASLA